MMKSKHLALIVLFGMFSMLLTSCGDDEVITTITANNLTLSIPENPTAGQVLGTVPGETNQGALTYSILSQNPTGAFALNAETGEISVSDASLFNYEVNPALTATVLIANGNIEEQVTATVNLEDLKESAITSAASNDDNNSNATVRGDRSRVKFANDSRPFVIVDGYNSNYNYKLILTGMAHKEQYTFDLLGADDDNDNHLLSFSSATADLKSDYYYAEILEVETNESFEVVTSDGDRTRFVDTDGADYWGDIQIETENWVKVDQIKSKTNFRMRPIPSVLSTAGKLYFYDQDYNVVDSLNRSGANGSTRDGVTTWYSLRFNGINGADQLSLTAGDYKINFKSPDGKASPMIDIEFVIED